MAGPDPSPDRRLTRSREDRLLGGVAGGVAELLGIDPTLVRIGFVLLAVFGGSGFVLYLAMWLLVPPAEDSTRPVDANLRASVGEMREAARGIAGDVRAGWQRDDDGDGSEPDAAAGDDAADTQPDAPPVDDEPATTGT
jgi:phage shock protein C